MLVQPPKNKVQVEVVAPRLTPADQDDPAPEHPFRKAKDAAYTPPINRNIRAPEVLVAKKVEPAYKTQPSIYKALIATDIYSQTMDTPITITQQELFSLAPEVCTQVCDAVTTKWIVTSNNQAAAINVTNFLWIDESEDEEVSAEPNLAIQNLCHRVPPEGALVIQDPIETYINSLPYGATPDPDKLKVSYKNAVVWFIFLLVDNNRQKECILDLGCQVITISRAVSHKLGITYDPTFRISMQSANGEYGAR